MIPPAGVSELANHGIFHEQYSMELLSGETASLTLVEVHRLFIRLADFANVMSDEVCAICCSILQSIYVLPHNNFAFRQEMRPSRPLMVWDTIV